jgi:hypothetical protein
MSSSPGGNAILTSYLDFNLVWGSGFIFASRPRSWSDADDFSSAPISRAFSMNIFDCSFSSGFGFV